MPGKGGRSSSSKREKGPKCELRPLPPIEASRALHEAAAAFRSAYETRDDKLILASRKSLFAAQEAAGIKPHANLAMLDELNEIPSDFLRLFHRDEDPETPDGH